MNAEINIYCDESCHLENDKQKSMAIGGIWCNKNKIKEVSENILKIQQNHNISKEFEIKWTKISPSKEKFYLDLISYFFEEEALNFRSIVIPDKSVLNHGLFNQSHDDWYYKMYFYMLNYLLLSDCILNIYIDIKDTKSGFKIKRLHDILKYTHSNKNVKLNKIQMVRSHEVKILQLADLLIGAITYLNRELSSSRVKNLIIEKIKIFSGSDLKTSSHNGAIKFDLFFWNPS